MAVLGHPYHILAKLPYTDVFNVATDTVADPSPSLTALFIVEQAIQDSFCWPSLGNLW